MSRVIRDKNMRGASKKNSIALGESSLARGAARSRLARVSFGNRNVLRGDQLVVE
jgi:hypothetical protein